MFLKTVLLYFVFHNVSSSPVCTEENSDDFHHIITLFLKVPFLLRKQLMAASTSHGKFFNSTILWLLYQSCKYYCQPFSHVHLFETPWTVARQVPLFMEFSRQEYQSGYGVFSHSPLQGIFPTQGLNLGIQHCRQILYHLKYQGTPYQGYLFQFRLGQKEIIQKQLMPVFKGRKFKVRITIQQKKIRLKE